MRKVSIILASYNGEYFLQQQIESILGQVNSNWDLIIQDDGSSDHSYDILKSLTSKDVRISTIRKNTSNKGVLGNFHSLMVQAHRSSCRYITFSDQDDVWNPDKLADQTTLMDEMESLYPGQPVLIHSDMEVVDAGLGSIHRSFMKYQNIHNECTAPLKVLLAQNFVTGCTVMINQPLLEIALPVPNDALMHDWWLALCAATFGHIGYIDKPLVKYRQHGKNEIGAKYSYDFINPFTAKWTKCWSAGRNNLFQSMKQAQALADRVREHNPGNSDLPLIEKYASLVNISPAQRIRRIRELGIHAQSNIRQGLLLSRLLLTPQAQNE
jgi:glycosyltransferase involved in cell wall biosynthesis